MAKSIHKGTELNNVSETWDQNERDRPRSDAGNTGDDATTTGSGLEQVIKEEASEYDNANKDERGLGGERASVNDDEEQSGDDA